MGGWLSMWWAPSSRKVTFPSGRRVVIYSVIGEGGFSYVHQAYDPYTGELFALKKTICQTPEQLERAKWEVEVYKKLNNEYILHPVDDAVITGTNESSVMILMPLFKNGTLQDFISSPQRTTKTLPDMLTFFLRVCEAVLCFHSLNPKLAVRDIKPGNVLLTDDWHPVLMDFASVDQARVTLTSRQLVGEMQESVESFTTPLYRAPEMFNFHVGTSFDERTDSWALGCLLYAMLFGVSPFDQAVKSGSIALAVINPVKIPGSLPHSVCSLLHSMLQIDPEERVFVPQIIEMTNAALQELSPPDTAPNTTQDKQPSTPTTTTTTTTSTTTTGTSGNDSEV
ncbi:NAK/MPSK protein kinase [Pelomyxa schiedti]|nr:NAK/MPSK protein kinase [Pelomyxa schiedti]